MSQDSLQARCCLPSWSQQARDFTRSHGLQTSILFLIPLIQFTCLPDCPLLTLGKDRNRRLLSSPRERLSSLKDSTNAVFFLHRHIQWAVSMATNIPPHSWISPISFYFFLSPSKRLSALSYYEELTVVNCPKLSFRPCFTYKAKMSIPVWQVPLRYFERNFSGASTIFLAKNWVSAKISSKITCQTALDTLFLST